ncbi:hypothetical protein [Luteibacter sp. 9135]|uniref:hypothetical protein n=1 Tax=Xanthomonas sp. NCPPB 2632 TaxID=3240912 RepID=UPI00056238B9
MQRTPGKRDYGSSDSAHLRSLASRGLPPSSPQARPAGSKHKDRPEGSRVVVPGVQDRGKRAST